MILFLEIKKYLSVKFTEPLPRTMIFIAQRGGSPMKDEILTYQINNGLILLCLALTMDQKSGRIN